MPMCKYFLEGRCAYGSNCRNDHQYSYNPPHRSYNPVNHPTYEHAYGNRKPEPAPAPSGNPKTGKVQKLFDDFMQEVIAAERGGQWPLSCFVPIRDRPGIPGFQDVSPEELRWKYYDLKNTGKPIGSYVDWTNQLMKDVSAARKFLKDPTPRLWAMLGDFIDGKFQPENSSTSAKSTFRFDTGQGSIFGGSSSHVPSTNNIFGQKSNNDVAPSSSTSIFSQQSSGNIFGQSSTSSVFGAPSVPTSTPAAAQANIFSAPSQSVFSSGPNTAGDIFSQPVGQAQNIFGNHVPSSAPNVKNNSQSIFSSGQSAAANVFSQPVVQAQSIFGTPVSTIAPNSNIFGGASQPFAQTSVSSNVFEKPSALSSNSVVYSSAEELTPEEKAAFEAPTFSLGKVPLKPPMQAACW